MQAIVRDLADGLERVLETSLYSCARTRSSIHEAGAMTKYQVCEVVSPLVQRSAVGRQGAGDHTVYRLACYRVAKASRTVAA